MTKIFNNKSAIAKVVCLMVVAGVMATIATISFAAGGDIAAAIKSMISDVWGVMNAIINPLCVVFIGFNIVRLIFGANSKSADASISWIKRIVIAFVCFNCLGLLLTFVTDHLDSSWRWNP